MKKIFTNYELKEFLIKDIERFIKNNMPKDKYPLDVIVEIIKEEKAN